MPRYELSDGDSNKFWDIELSGKSHKIKFGKIGSTGQTQLKDFASPPAAKAAYDKLIAEKTKKGYTLAGAVKPTVPVAATAANPKLEAAIAADPEDAEAYLVYADWLQAQGDPRGELIVLQHGNKTAAAKKHLATHAAALWGKLADVQDMLVPFEHGPLGAPTAWRWGYLHTAWISNKYERSEMHDGDLPAIAVPDALGWLLAHPSAKYLRELAVGIVDYESNSYAAVAKAIGKHRLPALKKLILGDFYYEETELNWSDLGPLQPLYAAVPNLETLVLRSGTMNLGTIDLPKLRELRIITGGLDRKSLKSICSAKWPALETLNVQLGRDTEFTRKDLQPIFDGTAFPRVTHLGLGNSTISDDICAGLASSKIAARLVSLDLTKGTMGSSGAAALAAGKFPKLATLDVSGNYLTKADLAALKPVAKQVISQGATKGRDREAQREDGGDPEDRYIGAYE